MDPGHEPKFFHAGFRVMNTKDATRYHFDHIFSMLGYVIADNWIPNMLKVLLHIKLWHTKGITAPTLDDNTMDEDIHNEITQITEEWKPWIETRFRKDIKNQVLMHINSQCKHSFYKSRGITVRNQERLAIFDQITKQLQDLQNEQIEKLTNPKIIFKNASPAFDFDAEEAFQNHLIELIETNNGQTPMLFKDVLQAMLAFVNSEECPNIFPDVSKVVDTYWTLQEELKGDYYDKMFRLIHDTIRTHLNQERNYNLPMVPENELDDYSSSIASDCEAASEGTYHYESSSDSDSEAASEGIEDPKKGASDGTEGPEASCEGTEHPKKGAEGAEGTEDPKKGAEGAEGTEDPTEAKGPEAEDHNNKRKINASDKRPNYVRNVKPKTDF